MLKTNIMYISILTYGYINYINIFGWNLDSVEIVFAATTI